MKPLYVVLLMGAAAIGGGLVVRYSEHPVEITLARPAPPPVVAPPIPPKARIGPSTSVPVSAPVRETPAGAPAATRQDASTPAPAAKPEKPSALSALVHVSRHETSAPESHPQARVRIPPDPPDVIPLERSTAPSSSPPQKLAVAEPPHHAEDLQPAGVLRTPDTAIPAQATPVQQKPGEPNHATLRAGMLIAIRIGQALSSNVNSPGDVFTGTLDRPLIADGFVIAERGAQVRGEVVESKSAGSQSELTIRLREILTSDGQRVHVVSDPWRTLSTGYDRRPRSVYDIPLTRGGAAVIRPATNITFRLDEPVELTEKR